MKLKILCLTVATCLLIILLCGCEKEQTVSKIPLDTSSNTTTSSVSSAKNTSSKQKKNTETSKPKSSSSAKQSSKNSSEKEKLTFSIPSYTPHINPIGKSLPFIGRWKGSYDVADLFEYDNLPAFPVAYTISFYEYSPSIFDKKVNIYKEEIDEDSFRSALQTILPKVMQEEFKAQNISQAEFEADIGMTLSEYIDAYIEELMPLTSYSTEWKYNDDKLYIYDETKEDFEHVPYSLKGDNKLSLTMDGETITYTKVS